MPALEELREEHLIEIGEDRLWLTDRGRLLSNEVFSRILLPTPADIYPVHSI